MLIVNATLLIVDLGDHPFIPQDKIDTITTLQAQGLSLRRIAKEIGIHHGTVAEYLRN